MNRSKQKGTAAETAVVRWLNDNGQPAAERRALHGSADKGDVANVFARRPFRSGDGYTLDAVVIEVKNCARTELAVWVDELEAEMRNAGADLGAVIHKRRGKSDPGQWFATLPFHVLIRLLNSTENPS